MTTNSDIALPTEMTIAGRNYGIIGFLKDDESLILYSRMVARLKSTGATLGEEDGQHILDHQREIPQVLRGKIIFVFTGWRLDDPPFIPKDSIIALIMWSERDDSWVRRGASIDIKWDSDFGALFHK